MFSVSLVFCFHVKNEEFKDKLVENLPIASDFSVVNFIIE